MTTMRDIKDQGGKCEKVATDFWECTDREGKVWWCSDSGNACVPKPFVGSGGGYGDCGCGGGKKGHPVQDEIDKLGQASLLRKIRTAAKKAYASLPDQEDIAKLKPLSRRFIDRLGETIEAGMKAGDWNQDAIAHYASEVAWGGLLCDVAVSHLARDNSGGGAGPTCVTKCADEYHQCISENGCDTSDWACLCCVPCSLQYMGCVAMCTVRAGGFSGIAIA